MACIDKSMLQSTRFVWKPNPLWSIYPDSDLRNDVATYHAHRRGNTHWTEFLPGRYINLFQWRRQLISEDDDCGRAREFRKTAPMLQPLLVV